MFKKREMKFIDFLNKDIKNLEDRERIKRNFQRVRDMYIEKIKNGMSIQEERFYIEMKLLRYTTNTAKMYISIILSTISGLTGAYISLALSSEKGMDLSIRFIIVFIIVFIMLYYRLIKPMIKESVEGQYYNMCLQVLSKLEEEIIENKLARLAEFHGIK